MKILDSSYMQELNYQMYRRIETKFITNYMAPFHSISHPHFIPLV